MNKKLLILGGIIVIIVLGFVFFNGEKNGDGDDGSRLEVGSDSAFIDVESRNIPTPDIGIISETGTIYLYEINGAYINGAGVQLHYGANGGYPVINLALDLNSNGTFSEDEWKVKNVSAYVKDGTNNLYEIELPELGSVDTSTLNAQATFSKEKLDSSWLTDSETRNVTLTIEQEDLTEILGINEPGYVPGLYRGGALPNLIRVAHAQTDFTAPDLDIDLSYTIGDLPQGNMECGPTSITNNLRGLASANGVTNLPSAQTMIDQLKTDLKFGDEGKAGVLDKNYLAGKNAFMNRHNLPIVTTEITNPGYQDVVDALQSGAVIEMDLAFFQRGDGGGLTQVGSHLVPVTGISSNGGDFTLRGRDSATNVPGASASESWTFVPKGGNIRQSQLVYPKNAGGATIINKIYIQTWGTVDTAIAAGVLPAGAVGSTLPVEMLVIDGNYYPKDQFHIGNNPKDNCKVPHYHKNSEAVGLRDKINTNLAFKMDPDGDGCGFGEVSKIPVELVRINWEQQQSLAAGLVTP
jgi:hypothetical protein